MSTRSTLTEPSHWLKRAEDIRLQADAALDGKSRSILLNLAECLSRRTNQDIQTDDGHRGRLTPPENGLRVVEQRVHSETTKSRWQC
jgi:hypothetical protein